MEIPKEIGTFLNNKVLTDNPATKIIVSPTTNETLTTIHLSSTEEVSNAIKAAETAFQQWKQSQPQVRSKILSAIASGIRDKKDLFAETMTLEMGKTVKDALAEAEYAAGYFDWFAKEAERNLDTEIPSKNPNKKLRLFYQPIGPSALITPWNFPLAIPARKIAAALAAGCTTVIKPTPECPLSVFHLASLAQESGLPEGCINVVYGPGKEIGPLLLSDQAIKKISFTGSTEVGKILFQQASFTLKKLTLELGGHAPLIVFNDANLKTAVTQTIAAKLRNSGQTCVAPNRIYMQTKIYDAFVEELVKQVQELKCGDPLNPETDLTSVLHPSSAAKVTEHIEDAMEKGATALLKGDNPYQPTILEQVTPSMKLFQEETFGPVFPLIKFNTDEEVINAANDTPYGLAAYVFTDSTERGYHTTAQLNYGIIGLNDGVPSAPEASFGGMKESGFGREGGPNGIKEYLVEKCVSLHL